LLIYFAAKYQRASIGDFYTWTAISRPPYLTALALWPGIGAYWPGGGLFEHDRSVHISQGKWKEILNTPRPRNFRIRFDWKWRTELPPVLIRRLIRDGWQASKERHWIWRASKRSVCGSYQLDMMWNESKLNRPIVYTIRDLGTGLDTPMEEVDWAELDLAGRLVYTRSCSLYHASYGGSGLTDETLIADFTCSQPGELAAAEWATRW
jgi:hypothetical protein